MARRPAGYVCNWLAPCGWLDGWMVGCLASRLAGSVAG